MFLIPYPLAVGFPLVPSPWGDGVGRRGKNSIIPFHTPLACGGVVEFDSEIKESGNFQMF